MRVIGTGLASLGVAAALVGFLFAFWAHEDIKQASHFGDAYLQKGMDEAVVEAVFRREEDKLESERLLWGLVALGGIIAVPVGWGLATVRPSFPGRKATPPVA